MEVVNKLVPWIALFFLNDFGFAALQTRPLPFYLFDYAVRIVVLIGILKTTAREQRLWNPPQLKAGVLWSLALIFLGILQTTTLDPRIPEWGPHLFTFPAPPSPAFRIWDLSIGILLVALSEETLFRGVLLHRLQNKTHLKYLARFLIQTLLFAGMHWGLGIKNVATSWIWSIAPTLSVASTGSIWPAVAGHFITDVVAFW